MTILRPAEPDRSGADGRDLGLRSADHLREEVSAYASWAEADQAELRAMARLLRPLGADLP